jgi:hypothetical protein
MLTVLSDHEGAVHHEHIPQGHTTHQHFYDQVLRQLHDADTKAGIQQVANSPWQCTCPLSPAFTAICSIPQVRQSLHSQDMVP